MFIGYAARLRWGALRLGYSQTLIRCGGRTWPARSSLRYREPRSGPDGLRWRALGCEGIWKASAPALSRTLMAGGSEGIAWECLAPRAEARVRLRGGETIAGGGYAERLTLTTRPDRLPIQELRWGRFHGPGATAVWIDWKGLEPRRWVFLNGDESADARVEDAEISIGSGRLALEPGTLLRQGPLVSSALARWPLRWLLPRRALALHETKRFGPARLSRPGVDPIDGTAIWEVVRWP